MLIGQHRQKALAIERSMERLGINDHEMLIEACMLAGTHWFNLLLHRVGLSEPQHDVMHAEFMTLCDRRIMAIRAPGALSALDEIEALRTTHVRGDMPDGHAAARRALERLRQLREASDAGA